MCAMGGDWYFYSPQAYDAGQFTSDNIRHRKLAVPGVLGGSQASQLLFPRWMRQDAIDIFWGPRHHLPFFMPSHIHCVLTVHDLVWRQQAQSMRWSRRTVERLLMPRSLRRADQIVTVSNCVAGELAEAFAPCSSKLSVIPSAASLQTGRADDGAHAGGDYLLFVGTMEPRKNLAGLLRAYKQYAARCDDARKLKVVGGAGWGGVDPHSLVLEYGLADRVEVLGKVSDEDLSNLYSGAYALVMPSFYEGFGLPVVEALAHGTPAIVSADTALSEVAGDAGYTVDPLSEQDISDALYRLHLDSGLYNQLQGRTLARAAEFSWDRAAADIYALLLNHG
jgi:glycosyltransferase involved in cell wall biosynthesis